MGEAIKGIDKVLFFRLLEDDTKKDAAKVLYQTEHEVGLSSDSDSTETKDGPVTTQSSVEEEISGTALASRGDSVLKMLKHAMREKKVVECWIVDRGEANEEGKYEATYRQGYMTEFNETAPADDMVEVDYTFKTNGEAKEGVTDLSEEMQEAIDYAFRDLQKIQEGETEEEVGA